MARFTQEQIEEIKNSEEFKQYLEMAGEDETNLALTHYLQNARNEAFWANQFLRREQNEANEAQDNNQMPREYSAADIDRYLKYQEEYLNRTDDTPNADGKTAFELIHENGQNDLRAFIAGTLTINPDAYEKMEEFIRVFAGDYKDEDMVKLRSEAIDKLNSLKAEREKNKGEATSQLLNSVSDDEQQQEKPDEQNAWDEVFGADNFSNQDQNETSDARVNDVQENSIQDNAQITDEPDTKEFDSDKWRERSLNSDANEFIMDKAKLQALLSMGIINQEIYDAAIKNPLAAIEKLQEKLPLDDKKQIEFENALSEELLNTPELFTFMPPYLLAKEYTKYNEQAKENLKQDPNADISVLQEKISKLAERIDTLSLDMRDHRNLFYSDITNIGDTYNGYMEMFAAREKYLDDSEHSAEIKRAISDDRATLTEIIEDYDQTWNLQDVKESDADKLNKRFNEVSVALEKTVLDKETLKLVSNFKFFDEKGEIEPQFIDKNGNKKHTYDEGDEIIKGGKLETIIRIARQNILMNQIGADNEISVDSLNESLKEEVPTVLYAAHVAAETEKGIKENPKQFTDKAYLNKFKEDLSNPEKPMGVSATAYEATIDNLVNSVGAYATRLGSKIGKDKPVVTKVFEPLKDIDKRAGDRTTGTVDKRKVRIQQLKRVAKGAASAFLVSGAITVAGAAVAADASMTAATLGMNKYAGMAVGSALAVGMTIYQIRRWRKDRKAHGEKTGFLAMLKDRRLRQTIETTALGCAALGFAVTGNPGVAQCLGYGAMAVGTTNSVISSYQDVKKAELSGWEAFGWATLQAVATVGGGLAGRYTANAGIDAFNKANPENEIFQHKETTVHTTVKETIVYKTEAIENAHKILNYWYKDNPDLLQQRIDSINSYNEINGTNINPERYLLAAHDAGALSADNNLLHVQGGADVATGANHKVLGIGWSNETGVSQDTVKSLANSISGDGVNITPESLKAFGRIDQYIDVNNHVGHVQGAPYQNDGVLGYDSKVGADGKVEVAADGDRYTTYANHGGATEVQKTTHDTITSRMVRNESDLGLGMVGVLGSITRKTKKLKDRIGALADKLFSQKENKIIVNPEHDVQVVVPEHDVKKVERQEDNSQDLLNKEYKIVHGIEPKPAEQVRYRALVQKEWETEGKAADFSKYLEKRMTTFENEIGNIMAPQEDNHQGIVDKPETKAIINQARERMWKLPQGDKGTADETLITFQKKYVLKKLSNDGVRDATLSSEKFDPKKGVVGKVRHNPNAR